MLIHGSGSSSLSLPTQYWIYEIKHDVYCCQVLLQQGQGRVFTRNGHDWTDRFPSIVRAAANLRRRRSERFCNVRPGPLTSPNARFLYANPSPQGQCVLEMYVGGVGQLSEPYDAECQGCRRRCLLLLEPYHLRPKRIPTSASPRFSSQRLALDM